MHLNPWCFSVFSTKSDRNLTGRWLCTKISTPSTHTHAHRHTQTHTHEHTHTHTHTDTHTNTHVHRHTHTHMNTRTHTHTHAHTMYISVPPEERKNIYGSLSSEQVSLTESQILRVRVVLILIQVSENVSDTVCARPNTMWFISH